MAVSSGEKPHFEVEELYLGNKLHYESSEICRSISYERELSKSRARQEVEKETEGRDGVSVGKILFVALVACNQREMQVVLQKQSNFHKCS